MGYDCPVWLRITESNPVSTPRKKGRDKGENGGTEIVAVKGNVEREFKSISSCAKELGISKVTVTNYLNAPTAIDGWLLKEVAKYG